MQQISHRTYRNKIQKRQQEVMKLQNQFATMIWYDHNNQPFEHSIHSVLNTEKSWPYELPT